MAEAEFDPARLAKILLRRSRTGALATLMAGSGDPYCSLVSTATAPDGSPILLISKLAVHTRNILQDPRLSLMLHDEDAQGVEGARIMVAGAAESVEGDDLAICRRRYLAAHPAAEAYASFSDFVWFRIKPRNLHLVAGFGRIVDLQPVQFLTDLTGAKELIDGEPHVIDHVNADHRDALELYATRLLDGPSGDWRCSGCDPEGLDLQQWDGETPSKQRNGVLRLDFAERVTTLAALRHILRDLAQRARAGQS